MVGTRDLIATITWRHAFRVPMDEQQGARGGWTEWVNDEQARQRGAREFKKGNL